MPNEARGALILLATGLLTAAAYQVSLAVALATLGVLLLGLAIVPGRLGGRNGGAR